MDGGSWSNVDCGSTLSQPSGSFEPFANGFAGGEKSPREAAHRPSGLAQGPDGSLYNADDKGGRIWRIYYVGESGTM